jgi:predicted nuclease of predicted toxin-antitoxin system
MKIKLDENLPSEIVELLESGGHDVHTVRSEGLAGRDDDVVFRAASGEGRLLITQDLDFSDLRKFSPGTHPGVVLVRLRDPSRRRPLQRVRTPLSEHQLESMSRCFVVVTDRKARVRSP